MEYNNHDITDHLPVDAIDIMKMLFERGNVVKDFKLSGNSRGYSMTLHITHSETSPTQWTPASMGTPLSTPLSNGKSPSASQRDYNRRQTWITDKNPKGSPIATQTEEETFLGEIDPNLVEYFEAEITSSPIDTIRKSGSHNCLTKIGVDSDSDMTEDQPMVCGNPGHMKPMLDTPNSDKKCNVFRTVELAQRVLKDQTYAKCVFKDAILNPCRNAMYCKMVHNNQTGTNCVVGLADDLLIRYDTTNKNFTHWIVTHLNNSDMQYKRCMDLLKASEPIAYGTHTEGVDKLVILLDKLVAQHQDYAR